MREVPSRVAQQQFSAIIDDALSGRDTGIRRHSRRVAVVVSAEKYDQWEERMSEEQKEYKVTRPPSIANRTPRRHARQLLEEQFGGNIPHLRRYLLRMIESLEDVEEQP